MAYCSRCQGVMGSREAVCPHCGFDFPETRTSPAPTGIFYSAWADIALMIAAVLSAFACGIAAFVAVGMLFAARYVEGLVVGPLVIIFNFALAIVFVRAQKM